MVLRFTAAALVAASFFMPMAANAKTVCTIITDVKNGAVLLSEGNCSERVTPASTFKIALSLMGFDAAIFKDAHTPELPFKDGYVDWGGDNWRQPTDPTRWLKYSVVWYSQQLTHMLGAERFHQYALKFDYGNADLSGDPGKDNGLDYSWIGSSLKISPQEQVAFLRKLWNRQLPVSAAATELTLAVVEHFPVEGGWDIQGKTGAATPQPVPGMPDNEQQFGWFVGWASKGDRTLVFARLIRNDKKEEGSAGLRARTAFLKEIPALADALVKKDKPAAK